MTIIFENYNANDDDIFAVYGTLWKAQTFTIGAVSQDGDIRLNSIKIQGTKVGSPGNIDFEIREISGGEPSGDIISTGSYNGNSFPAYPTRGWSTVISMTACVLQANTQYAIIAKIPSGNVSNYVGWGHDRTSPTYNGGHAWNSSDSGDTWAANSSYDQMFEIWGNSNFISSASATSGISGSLSFTETVIASISVAISNLYGILDSQPGLGSSIVEISGIAGSLGEIEITTRLMGSITVVCGADSIFEVETKLVGSIDGVSGVNGLFEFSSELIGVITEVSNLYGILDSQPGLGSLITEISGVTGSLGKIDIATKLRGVSAGISGADGTLNIETKLRCYIAVVSGVDGYLNFRFLSIPITGVSGVDGILDSQPGLGSSIVEISGTAGALGEIEIATKLRGVSAGVFGADGNLDSQPGLVGIINGVSDVNIDLSVLKNLHVLAGTFVVESSLTGYLSIIPDFEAATLFWRPQGDIIETLEWKTSVLKAYDGSEQRIKVRQTPRQYFNLQLLIETEDLNTWYDSIIHTWQKSAWLLPIWTEYAEHFTDIDIKDDIIEVDTTYADFRDGGKALIWKSSTEYEIVVISTKTDSQLNLSYSILNSFTGIKYIIPVRTAYMTSSSNKEITNSPVSIIDLIFAVHDNIEISGYTINSSYDEYEILDTPAFMEDTHSENSDGDLIIIDFDVGVFKVDSHSNFNILTQNHNFFNDTKEACWNFRQFLNSLSGRQKTILIPTFRNDIIQTDNINITDTSVKIENINLASNMGSNNLRDYIGFYFPDGTLIVRKITAISKLSSLKEQITFNTNLGLTYAIEPGGCKICFVDKCRLASDRVQMRWHYAHRNECRTNFVRVT